MLTHSSSARMCTKILEDSRKILAAKIFINLGNSAALPIRFFSAAAANTIIVCLWFLRFSTGSRSALVTSGPSRFWSNV
ncbi:MAG: hypothetical protein MHMPM18_003498 [Marteilia pararefringens]